MENRDDRPPGAPELRRRAEELAGRMPGPGPEELAAQPPETVIRMVHELQVHRIELELQNEDLRRAQAELEASRARYFNLYDQAPVGYCTLCRNGTIREVNRTAAELLGRERQGLEGRALAALIAAPDRELFRTRWNRFLETGEAFTCDLRLVRGDGQPVWVRLTGNAAEHLPEDPGARPGPPVRARITLSDLSEAKRAEREQARLEAQMRHARRLESIGFLAGGLAHDFNNILGAMAGNLDLLHLDLAPQGPAEARLDALDALLARASTLVGQILTFAGNGKIQVQALDLNRQAESAAALARSALGPRTALGLELAPGLPPMLGDPAQVQQAILNLVLNAVEALGPGGGVITLRSGVEDLGPEQVDERYPGQGLHPGPHLALEVADQGHGMSPDVQERIFDPFFTTRFTGRGLGLSVVHGIVLGHQGAIRVDSAEGRGTSIRLVFPAAPAQEPGVRRQRPAAPVPGGLPQGTGCVLIVEDEEAMRQVAAGTLRRLGFEPLEAGDGLEALEVYQANRDKVRLVLMDVTMPRMDGEQAYRALRRAGATVPIVLTSGFGTEEALRPFRGRAVAGFLPKPYRVRELAEAIRNALEGRSGPGRPAPDSPGERVAWWRDLETGHPVLDLQHRSLLQAVDVIQAAVARGTRARAAQALARLMDEALTHFGFEESQMFATAFPGAREHQADHAQLMLQLQRVAARVGPDGAGFTPELLDFIQDWVVCHMQAEDQQLARHLRAGGH